MSRISLRYLSMTVAASIAVLFFILVGTAETALAQNEGWIIVRDGSDPGLPTTHLADIWGLGPNDIHVVGDSGYFLHSTDGTTWTTVTSQVTLTQNFNGVWGAATDDIWAVGQSGRIAHYDGTSWSLFAIIPGGFNFFAVWGSAADDVYAVGGGGNIYHYNGTVWSNIPIPGTVLNRNRALNDIWGADASNIFIVGASGRILHYDGAGGFTVQDLPSGSNPTLRGVWGFDANNVFAVGNSNGTVRYNGSAWSDMVNANTPSVRMQTVWGDAVDDVHAAGNDGRFVRYDGNGANTWHLLNAEIPNKHMRGLWGASADRVYAVGNNNRIMRLARLLDIEKSVNDAMPASGDTITYTVVVSASGVLSATDGVISDTIPTGLHYVAGSAVLDPGGSGTIGAPPEIVTGLTVTGGTSVTLTYQVTVSLDSQGQTITNTAWVTSTEVSTPISDSAQIVVDFTGPCFAEIDNDNVTDFASADAAAVQAAIDAVIPGGTVKLAGYCKGVTSSGGSDQTGHLNKNLTLRGGYLNTDWSTSDPDTYPTTLDADAGGRVLVVEGDVSVTVENLRLLNGATSDNGGGVSVDSSTVTISNTIVSGNSTSSDGGGIYNTGSSSHVTITGGSSVALNTTGGVSGREGGGIYNDSGTIAIVASSVTTNTGFRGGGIYNTGGTVTLEESAVVSNTASNDGGGIHSIGSGATLSVTSDSLIALNVATSSNDDGGGIYNVSGMVAIVASGVTTNTGFRGGGIYNERGTVTIEESEVVANRANSTGGGIHSAHGSATLTVASNSLIALNTTAGGTAHHGGGIYNAAGTVAIVASGVTTNTGYRGGGIYNTAGSVTVEATEVISNTAADHGGGLYNVSPSAKMTVTSNSLIALNIASGTNDDGGGVYNSGGTVSISDSRLLTNTAVGDGGGLYQHSGTATIAGSCVVGNSDFAVHRNSGTNPLTATNNWWGAPDGPSPSGSGDSVSSNVSFSPFQSAPILGCPGEAGTPDLSVEKTVNEVNPQSNDTITYTLVISNGGYGPATGGVISDVIPTGLTYVANSATLEPAGAGTVGAPPHLVSGLTITAGTSVTLTFQATVNGGLTDGTTITNTAWVTSTETPTPATGSVTITVGSPAVEDITVELALAGMAITNFESGGGDYGAGILDWVWTILNPNVAPVSNIYIDVIQLDASIAEVINRDGGTPPGVGARVSVPNSALGGDNMLTTGESFAQLFQLGWKSYTGFTFQVQAFGVVGTPLVAGEPQLLGTFTVEFDPGMVDVEQPQQPTLDNKLFLPLISK